MADHVHLEALVRRLEERVRVLERDNAVLRVTHADAVAELKTLSVELEEKVGARAGALEASEARLRRALDAATMAVFEWDVEADEVRWSGAAGLLGLEDAALQGPPSVYLARVHAADRAAVEATLRRAREDREGRAHHRVEHRLASEGEARWLELHARVAGADGRRVSGVVLDATERRKLEEDLRQAQKMESVGQLAGGIAHDFNNLLTTILGVTELVLAGLREGDPTRDDLTTVCDAGRRAATLTRQLLAFSRKGPLEVRAVQVDEVVRGFAPMLARLIGEEVRMVLELAAGTPPVLADPSQLEQVLMNLAVNARDAMPAGGTLTIEVAPEHVLPGAPPEPAPGAWVRVSVVDTGAGMTPEVAARAFEPFFTTKPRGAGSGLGLATVYGVVKGHGGCVRVRTAPGKGARFDVFLPAAPPSSGEAREAPVAVRAAAGKGETVLVVDDEPLVRRAVRRVLQSKGYAVLEAGSGEEALAVVSGRAGEIDLLLTDVVMPGMRGPELVAAFQARCPGRPALLMSGYPEAHGGGAPQSGWLQKPIAAEDLARAVRSALDAAGG